MRTSRFERRIVLAMVIVVSASLFGAFGIGYVVVHDAFRMGVNENVRAALDEGVRARRAHLVAVRELVERTAEWLATDGTLVAAINAGERELAEARLRTALGTHASIARITVLVDGAPFAEVRGVVSPTDGPLRELSRTRPISLDGAAAAPGDDWAEPGAVVEVVLTEPERTFSSYQRAGDTAELLTRLDRRRDYVSNVYVAVYAAFVGVISLGALVLGLVLSRRVTRHIGTLADATREVGRGDLGVVVPVGSDDEIGELTRSFNAMVRDLREQRARIDTLQRISAWQDFARRLAHEIKNPLTPIKLAAQELSRSYHGDDAAFRRKLDDAHAIIEEEVATLRRLVTEFSNFSRLPEVSLAPADLVDVVHEFERAAPALLEDVHADPAMRAQLEVEVLATRVPVRLDAMMFRRALDNLVRNAAEAIRDQEGAGRIRVSLRVEGDLAVLDVEDDGPGVVAADRGRVFDPYYTTKADGTGLGLPIVMKVVLEHGGLIELAQGKLPGACFRVTIPLSPGSA